MTTSLIIRVAIVFEVYKGKKKKDDL